MCSLLPRTLFAKSVDLLHVAQGARNLRKLAAHAVQVLADVPQFICNFPQQSDNFLADPTDAGDDELTKSPEQPFHMASFDSLREPAPCQVAQSIEHEIDGRRGKSIRSAVGEAFA